MPVTFELSARQTRNLFLAEENLASIWLFELRDQPSQSSLTAPAFTHKPECFAYFYRDGNIIDSMDNTPATSEKSGFNGEVLNKVFNPE